MVDRRKKGNYFKIDADAPKSLNINLTRRVNFNEVDVMGIVWHGRYCQYFEEGSAALGRQCGLSYEDYLNAGVFAPIVQHHVDYYQPLFLDEEFTIYASLIWNEGARLNTEFKLIKKNGVIAATGYNVQMFIDAISKEPYFEQPELLKKCLKSWKDGVFECLQN